METRIRQATTVKSAYFNEKNLRALGASNGKENITVKAQTFFSFRAFSEKPNRGTSLALFSMRPITKLDLSPPSSSISIKQQKVDTQKMKMGPEIVSYLYKVRPSVG